MELFTQIIVAISKKACWTEHSILGEVKPQRWYIVVDRSEHNEKKFNKATHYENKIKNYAKSRIDSTIWRMMRSWFNIGLCVLYV